MARSYKVRLVLDFNHNRATRYIYIRITYAGKRSHITTGIMIDPIDWDPVKDRLYPTSTMNRGLNEELDRTFLNVRTLASEMFQDTSTHWDFPEAVRKRYFNEDALPIPGIIEVFAEYINARRDVDPELKLSRKTIYNYIRAKEDLHAWVITTFKKADIPIDQIKAPMAKELDNYLRKNRNLNSGATIQKKFDKFRRIFNYAVDMEYLDRNPFSNYKVKTNRLLKNNALTAEDFNRLVHAKMPSDNTEIARDLFLFSCITGLAHEELNNLSYDDIHRHMKGYHFIHMDRKKTSREFQTSIGSVAIGLIEKYRDHPKRKKRKGNRVFPSYANQVYNRLLKLVGEIAKLSNTEITSHLGRKTYATLSSEMGIDDQVVADSLGHSNSKITKDHYIKVSIDRKNNAYQEFNLLIEKIVNEGKM